MTVKAGKKTLTLIPRQRTRTASTIPSMGPLDCVQCGACCASYSAVEVSAITDPQTPQELTSPLDGHPEYSPEDIAKRKLRTMATSCGRRCIALRGTIGKKGISCAIYDKRPTVCRGYEKGSDACLQARSVMEFYLSSPERTDRCPGIFDPGDAE